MSITESIGPYRLVREIGRSNSVVYEAVDTRTGHPCALKVTTSTQMSSRLQFLREIKICTSLHHPNLVSAYQIGEVDGRAFMAMELLTGGTLFEEIETNGPISEARAAKVFPPILEALTFFHKRGIVHRDVKPHHIFLLEDGTVRLTDYGVAKLPIGPDIVPASGYIGTPEYMSPEQSEGREVDQRADLYSLGVTLYEALTGKNPFRGETIHAVLYSVKYKSPVRPDAISEQFWPVIQKAIAKKPESRFATAAEFLKGLEAFVA